MQRVTGVASLLFALAGFLLTREFPSWSTPYLVSTLLLVGGVLIVGKKSRAAVQFSAVILLLAALGLILVTGGITSPWLGLMLLAPLVCFACGQGGLAGEFALWSALGFGAVWLMKVTGLGDFAAHQFDGGADMWTRAGLAYAGVCLMLGGLAGPIRRASASRSAATEGMSIELEAVLAETDEKGVVRRVDGPAQELFVVRDLQPGHVLRHLARDSDAFGAWLDELAAGTAGSTRYAFEVVNSGAPMSAIAMAREDGPGWRFLIQPASGGDAAREAALEAELADARQQVKDRTAFYAGLGHDLKTPLNAIIGFADMMKGAWLGPLSETYRERAALIHESGQDLLLMVEDMLDLAKTDAGQYRLECEPVDLVASGRSVLRQLSDIARRNNIKLKVARGPRVWADADARAVRQIWQNLLSNALKYTGEGGEVVIGALQRKGRAVLFVSDTGQGMTAEEVARITEPFAQGANASARTGTGLGLSVVRQFAELHGGRVRVSSEPDKGTWVDVVLPLSTEANDVLDGSARAAE